MPFTFTISKPARILALLFILFIARPALAQAPKITYNTPQTYIVNKGITPLVPANTGGAVPATVYGQVSTLAGGFNTPTGVATDAAGNVYVADWGNNMIRKISPGGGVSTVAGNGSYGSVNGQGTATSFYNPDALVVDGAGNIYVADQTNNLIRKITQAGMVTTIAGNGTAALVDGTGTAASFSTPRGMAMDAAGNLLVADQANNAIRKITPAGVVTTYAGKALAGYNNGPLATALFNTPTGVYADAAGNIFVSDAGNGAIRKITPAGDVSTFATGFSFPRELRMDTAGNLFVADQNANVIKKITPAGVVTIFAGNGQAGATNGINTAATFNAPLGLWIDAFNNLYVGDSGSNQVRKISLSGYSIDKPLPAGLMFDPTTGIISGTPTALWASTNYTITAYNGNGSSSTIVNIQVLAILPSVITLPLQQPGMLDASNNYDPAGTSTNKETPITYTSSNSAVATVTANGLIHVIAPGITIITASQAGNTNYSAAIPVTQTLTVVEYFNTYLPPISAKTTCDADFDLNASVADPIVAPVFTSSNTGVATVSAQGVVHITGVGTTTITMLQTSTSPLYVSATPKTQTLTVSLPPSPAVTIAATYAGQCLGDAVSFKATAINGGAAPSYQWLVNGTNAGTNAATFSSTALLNGDAVSCVVTNNDNACLTGFKGTSNSIAVSLTTPSRPTVSIAASVNYVYTGVPITFTATVKDGAGTIGYQWQVNGRDAGTNKATFTASNFVTGDIVTCVITPIIACSTPAASNPLTVFIVTQLTIPNTFTPNGDGVNDQWNISGIANYPNCLVNIYNRYGILVYQSTRYAQAWNGTTNGGPVPTGTYYYLISDNLLPDKKLSGSITVIR